jgi:hypothetical protein
MKIFPKSITEEIWHEHLYSYSTTLVHYSTKVFSLLSNEHKNTTLNNIYICPLCLKHYFVNTESGIQGNAEFSLDHVPPESVGWKFKLITCKKCNNDSGIFESELEKILNFAIDKKNPEAFLIPKIEVKDLNSGKEIKGKIISKNNRTDIVFNEKAIEFDPQYIDFLSNLKNKKIQLNIPLFNHDKIEKALLKTAYLICFIWWGYEFVFSENGTLLRKVINNEMKYPLRVPILWLTENEKAPKGVCLLEYESKRLAFIVNIPLKGIDVNTTACVIIPNPTENGWSDLDQIKKLIEPNPKNFNCISLPRVLHRVGYSISWNIILPNNEK